MSQDFFDGKHNCDDRLPLTLGRLHAGPEGLFPLIIRLRASNRAEKLDK